MSNWMVTYNSSDLMHYGVEGQKWGIRRYQNPDGTLTELGKKRVREAHEHYTNAYYAKKAGNERRFNKEMRKYNKETSKMTVPEIKALLKRNKSLGNVQNMNINEVKNTQRTQNGVKTVAAILGAVATAATVTATILGIRNTLKNDKLNTEKLKSDIERNKKDVDWKDFNMRKSDPLSDAKRRFVAYDEKGRRL
ncbi:MAG: hypothetical protein J6Y02_23605 [Pseudobutyrivibrio sp.]|nr:hypothetical protein [Pseudobutyrivibrio sp.]